MTVDEDARERQRKKLRSKQRTESTTHQLVKVVMVEALANLIGAILKRALKALDRSTSAFNMRIVRREQDHFRARLLYNPPDIFGWIRGELHLPADVLARPK